MEFMFEDEVDEVGSDVEAYCPKCKADTTHVVISKYEDEIRRVQCNPCGDVHSFRKPRGEVEEDVPEPIAAKKRALLKKPTWEEFFAKHGEKALKSEKPYNFADSYHENNVVSHPKFGRGFVTELVSNAKVEITFKDGRRVLVHNRKDMPALPLSAEGDGVPSRGKRAAAAKAKAAKIAPAAARAAARKQAGPPPARPPFRPIGVALPKARATVKRPGKKTVSRAKRTRKRAVKRPPARKSARAAGKKRAKARKK